MTAERPALASVDAVREELRRLGYLESGLDRFVLAGARPASAFGASLRAALRLALVGGPLFGAALALAAAGLDGRLRSEPQDLVLLSAYLMLVAGAAIAVGALAGGLAAGWFGRRLGRRPGPGLAPNVGLTLAVGGLAYLAMWWRSHAHGAGAGMQAAAVALGLALSVALGRFGWLAAVAVLSAGGDSGRLPQASLSRRRLLPLVAAPAVLFGAGVAAASFLTARPQPAPDFAVVPTGLRVRVLGLDGLDPPMARQMLARGEMPELAALLAVAAHAPMRVEPERVPAIVWTTIATGRGPEAHGIQATGARRLAGMKTPVPLGDESRLARMVTRATDVLRLTRAQPPSAPLREAKAFWNVASEKGLRVGVVNWWATWPADPVNGFVVTDRALFRLEKGGPRDREAHPPAAWSALESVVAETRDDDRARRIDRFHMSAASALRGEQPPDMEAVYLPGLDIFTMQRLGEPRGLDLAGLDARLSAVRAYYRFVDGLLGEAVRGLGAEDVLVLVADPGRLARRTGAGAEGLIALAGRAVQPGALASASERDVAPTVLHLAGLPVSDELPGRVLEAAFRPSFRDAHPTRRVASYGRRPPGAPAESSFDQQTLEELRSLGYIE